VEVGQLHRTGDGLDGGVLRQWEVLDSVDEVATDRTAVEGTDALLADLAVGVGKVGVAEDRTDGGRPATGRNSFALELNWPSLTLFSVVWLTKAGSTTKPWSAICSAGRRFSARLKLPHRCSARCQVASMPGTPTDRPLATAVSNG
jgi:hypothetical protein